VRSRLLFPRKRSDAWKSSGLLILTVVKVIRKELFAGLRDPAVTIRDGNITFNTAASMTLMV
jgi:hypothetical protein